MAVESLLHSGSFVDYDGNEITISFYKKTDINAIPTVMSFSDLGGSKTLTIWSTDGDAYIGDPLVDWWNYTQIGAEPLPGSDFYKYTYRIQVQPNHTPNPRVDSIHIHLEGIGGVRLDVNISQIAER